MLMEFCKIFAKAQMETVRFLQQSLSGLQRQPHRVGHPHSGYLKPSYGSQGTGAPPQGYCRQLREHNFFLRKEKKFKKKSFLAEITQHEFFAFLNQEENFLYVSKSPSLNPL